MVCMMARDRAWNQRRAGPGRIQRALAACAFLCLTGGAVPAAMAVDMAASPDTEKPLFQWLFSLVMIALVCVIAFKNPKRSHQS